MYTYSTTLFLNCEQFWRAGGGWEVCMCLGSKFYGLCVSMTILLTAIVLNSYRVSGTQRAVF